MQGEKEGKRERNTSASAVPAIDKPKIKNRVGLDRQRNGKRGARTTTCESLDDRLVKCLP